MLQAALIERGDDGIFGIFTPDLESTIVGAGKTVAEAKQDFANSVNEVSAFFKETGNQTLIDIEFEYKFDVPSFLQYYSNILSLAGLGRLTGINQGQLSHYVTGRRKPSSKTVEKIEKSLHNFASEIGEIQFV